MHGQPDSKRTHAGSAPNSDSLAHGLNATNQPAEHLRSPALGVLLMNLGSPDAPTPSAIRRYLAEFLSDTRVIELPKLLWQIILRLFILPLRPAKIAPNYQRVWLKDNADTPDGGGGSPLVVYTRRLAAGVQQQLAGALPGPVLVDWAMCYGNPSVADKLRALQASGAERVLVMPLYPQYSGSTTGAAFDAVARSLMQTRWVPELRMVNHYCDDPRYIDALASSVREHWNKAEGADLDQGEEDRAEHLVMSFHGLPVRYITAGDPYVCHCYKTARLLSDALGLEPGTWSVTFQSQFGKARWVDPKTTDTLVSLAQAGTKTVDVICPGFAADCIETIDEIEVENREAFVAAGGVELRYIPALNDRADHARTIAHIAARHAQGWPESDGDEAQRARCATAQYAEGISLIQETPQSPA